MDEDQPALRQLIGRLRFRHLKLLVVLHEEGSLHGAASRLSVTQSALSKALGEVERAFGAILFERHARGLAPTKEGLLAVRGAALLLRELAHLGEEITSKPISTILRLGIPPTVAHGLLPDILHQLISGSSSISMRVTLLEDLVDPLMRRLLDGHLDAVISPWPTDMPEEAAGRLEHVVLHDVALVVVCAAEHPLASEAVVDWKQLQPGPWILPGPTSLVRRSVDNAFLNAGLVPPTILIESQNPYTNLQLVVKGMGLSAVPDTTLGSLETSLGIRLPLAKLNVRPNAAQGKIVMHYRRHSENHRVEALLRALERERSGPTLNEKLG